MSRYSFSILFTLFFISAAQAGQTAAPTISPQIDDWREYSFKGHTTYTIDTTAIKAMCENSASALYWKKKINLLETPVLRWSWTVADVHPELNEREKSDDDYPARLYVVYTPSVLTPWRTKVINYVWSNKQPVGTIWPSAYTKNSAMIAMRSGKPSISGEWKDEERNVRDDFKTYLNLDLTQINGVAIMTDCDNSRLPMTGYYKNIHLTRE